MNDVGKMAAQYERLCIEKDAEIASLRALLAEAEAALRRVDTSITDYSRGQQHFEVLQEVVENVRAALSRIAAAKEGGK